MYSQLLSSQASVEELILQILNNRAITYTDQLLLQYVLLAEEILDDSVRILIDRVFYGVRHGLLKIVD